MFYSMQDSVPGWILVKIKPKTRRIGSGRGAEIIEGVNIPEIDLIPQISFDVVLEAIVE